jgi:hypothetical protein
MFFKDLSNRISMTGTLFTDQGRCAASSRIAQY